MGSHPTLICENDRISGLRPKAWLCIGPGFSREEIKSFYLKDRLGFVGDAFTSVQDLCLKLTQISSENVLVSSARQEVLRILLAEKRISARFPELKRLRRQGGFFKRLDYSIQSGRMAFSHEQEEEVYSQRLSAKFGSNPVREEVSALAKAYEAWLLGSNFFDPPLLIQRAMEQLRPGWPEEIYRPEEIFYFSVQAPESLERGFWDEISRFVKVHEIGASIEGAADGNEPRLSWQRWHTLDDASEFLVETFAKEKCFEEDVILIPDLPAIRRTLKRALSTCEWGAIPESDPRDPMKLRWDESVKQALLPLEIVARNFERQKVISWTRTIQQNLIAEINNRGIRNGLASYYGGSLAPLHEKLKELSERFGQRLTCAQLGERHLKWIQETSQRELVFFFERAWSEFISDMEKTGQSAKKAPLLFWYERFQARILEMPAPVEKIRPQSGARVYRLSQAPVERFKRIWILGMPPSWLNSTSGATGIGDYWYSERDREILSAEFAVRSSVHMRKERLETLKAWITRAEEVRILDAEYDYDGRDRETLLPILKECGISFKEPLSMGAHPRWVPSYGAYRPVPPQALKLPQVAREITATALDHYSRCSFQGLAYSRWGLWDLREPDTELWPEVRGNILHEAVRILIESRGNSGDFKLSTKSALEHAWTAKSSKVKGLLRGQRIERYVKSKLVKILDSFCEDERKYVQRSKTTVRTLDDTRFSLECPEFVISGKPDRIDEHPEGLFILDYKTSTATPNGAKMLELGYRLQLPFYALAVKRETGKQVLGVQFVSLTKKSSRTSGVFFKKYNGKEKGNLTELRSNVKSLFSEEPDEIWSRFEDHIVKHATELVSGIFEAKPKDEADCRSCAASDLCGKRRVSEDDRSGS